MSKFACPARSRANSFISAAFFIIYAISLLQGARGDVPPPLETVVVSAYAGRWFQTHASVTVKWTFEIGANCVTADYGDSGVDGTLTVKNIVRPFFGLFFDIEINGFAAQSSDITNQGALSVILGPSADDADEAEFDDPGNYWIIALGPIVSGKYEWALVSDKDQRTLYVLARDPDEFESTYEDDVLDLCEEMGFTGFFNKPRVTNQKRCTYD